MVVIFQKNFNFVLLIPYLFKLENFETPNIAIFTSPGYPNAIRFSLEFFCFSSDLKENFVKTELKIFDRKFFSFRFKAEKK